VIANRFKVIEDKLSDPPAIRRRSSRQRRSSWVQINSGFFDIYGPPRDAREKSRLAEEKVAVIYPASCRGTGVRSSCPDGMRAHPRPYQSRSVGSAGSCLNQVFGNAERVSHAITSFHSSQLVVGDTSSIMATPRSRGDEPSLGGLPVPGLNQTLTKAPFAGS
jgi:hypothetical protein